MLSFSELIQWLNERQEIQGIQVSDILEFPDPLRLILQEMLRGSSMSLGEFSEQIHYPLSEAEEISSILVKKGYLVVTGEDGEDKTMYRVRLARIKGKQINIDF